MTRVRWLKAEWSASLKAMEAKMRAEQFRQNSNEGFILEKTRKNFVGGRYIERLNFTETIIDPFGAEINFNRVEYRTIVFRLTNVYPEIELLDVPRGYQRFISKLSTLNEFNVVISPLKVKLPEWVRNIKDSVGVGVAISSAFLSGIDLGSGISAKAIVKGEGEMSNAIGRLTGKQDYEIDKLDIKFNYADIMQGLQLQSSGSVNIHTRSSENVLQLLRETLPHTA
jgi:DNA-binding Lrp family transcriptional regulator